MRNYMSYGGGVNSVAMYLMMVSGRESDEII
jgi:hypothetical protein